MDLSKLKIGYSPYSPDASGPGDRRRLLFYAAERNLQVEIADTTKLYDLVYITSSANITSWINYKKKHPQVRLIFEMLDSFLLQKSSLKLYFKGISRYLNKREDRLYFDLRNAYINLVKLADAVVCSTSIQKQNIQQHNPAIPVHVSLDYFSGDIAHYKNSYHSGQKLKIGWEGQAYTVENLLELKEVFGRLGDRFELHIITDPEIKYPFKIFNKKTVDLLSVLPCSWHWHEWTRDNFSKLIAEMDMAVIPINAADLFTVNKPENKLLLLWEIGVPVITATTPAYTRVMEAAGLDACCSNDLEWEEKIMSLYKGGESAREAYMVKAKDYLASHHTKEIILNKWDAIFQSVIR